MSSTLALYRKLFREASHLKNYNFREYAKRRVRTSFVEGKPLAQDKLQSAIKEGKEELERLQRIKNVTNMYYQHDPFVVERASQKK